MWSYQKDVTANLKRLPLTWNSNIKPQIYHNCNGLKGIKYTFLNLGNNTSKNKTKQNFLAYRKNPKTEKQKTTLIKQSKILKIHV